MKCNDVSNYLRKIVWWFPNSNVQYCMYKYKRLSPFVLLSLYKVQRKCFFRTKYSKRCFAEVMWLYFERRGDIHILIVKLHVLTLCHLPTPGHQKPEAWLTQQRRWNAVITIAPSTPQISAIVPDHDFSHVLTSPSVDPLISLILLQ